MNATASSGTRTLDEVAQRGTDVSQATAIEQARAVAEVAAAVRVAKDFPRDVADATRQMLDACQSLDLAERAFYRVPNRGNGPSVHLAREMARCFGNIQHGIVELRRDDLKHESEVQAFAWDVQNNTRSVRSFIVPHARMAGGKRQALVDLGDITNNNNNAGARAVRETIFTVLPVGFREQAMEACRARLKQGDGSPLDERVASALRGWQAVLGISQQALEDKLGKPSNDWDEGDLATLVVLWSSIQQGDATVADEFPTDAGKVTGDEIAGKS